MNKAVTDVITSYKPRVINTLRDQQSALTPCVDPFIIEGQVTEYIYNTHRTLVDPNIEACFRCHYMYMKAMPPRKYIQYATCIESIGYLVDQEVISPFLFFVNKKMVPWSMIDIIMTHEDYFILCHTENPTWLAEFRNVQSLDVVHLPDGCLYHDMPIGDNPNETYTITISCGKLTTGVTVKAWTAVFYLAGSYSTSASAAVPLSVERHKVGFRLQTSDL